MPQLGRHIVILVILLALDLGSFYAFGETINLLFKPWFTVYLIVIFNANITKPISPKSTLVIVSLVTMLSGEFLFPFAQNPLIKVILLVIYLVEHQLYISIFREEKARLLDISKRVNLLKVLPYVLICFVFFGLLMMPNLPDNFLLLGIIYCVQLSILAALAVIRDKRGKTYYLVVLAIGILILSDALTSYSIFINDFFADYALIRVTFLVSKVIFVLGMYHSNRISHLDKEHT